MHFLHRALLPATVFITGACVLVIEIVATRILSPYFGNTLFTVSSVLSVVLAALSVGYYIGGKIADRHPSEKIFFAIIVASGFLVFLLHLLQTWLLPGIGYQLSLTTGPLIVAVGLFFLPSFLLGTLSPYAITLQKKRLQQEGIGSITGEMFFFSTVGSIAGSLLAGFVLLPNLGIATVVIGVGVALVLLGLVPLVVLKVRKKFLVSAAASGLIATLLCALVTPSAHVVYASDGLYERIAIQDGIYSGRAARFLVQDRSNSGAMFLNSDDLVYEYTKYFALYSLFTPKLDRALAIGGGAYSVPKALLRESPTVQVDAVEIEPSLPGLGKKYFHVPEDPRLHLYVEDGRRMLHDSAGEYDLIFSDVYQSLFSMPAHFTTKEFLQTAKDKLSANGVFIANTIGSLNPQGQSFVMSELKTMREVFPQVYAFGVRSATSITPQNIILVGHNNPQRVTLNQAVMQSSSHEVVRKAAYHLVDLTRFDFGRYPLLTDDFAPVEHLTSDILDQY